MIQVAAVPVFFKKVGLLAFLSLLFSFTAVAQICTGSFGDPVFTMDFDRGSSFYGPPLSTSITNYPYTTGTVPDGKYTIAQTSAGNYTSWHTIPNHTPNDPTGYMMIVNATNSPNTFFEKEVTGLCPNTTYEFAVWVFNLLINQGDRPSLSFEIYNASNTKFSSSSTGNIIESGQWVRYSHSFTTPATGGKIVLKIVSNATGGANGNDVALDDITFRPCGPKLNPKINSVIGMQASLCEGQTKSFLLEAEVESGYNVPEYQWQKIISGNWQNIPGENDKKITVNYINATPGTEQYRLLIAETGSINAINCRTTSQPYLLTVNALTTAIPASNSPVCIGKPIQLTSNEGMSYLWTGPNGFTSALRAPVIPDATPAMAGTYTLTLTNSSGCTTTAQTTVVINPLPVAAVSFAEITICSGTTTQLEASGGITYSWQPATGLSETNVANPIASPSETTLYTVTVFNGTCENTATVKVIVNKSASANAGTDKVIVEGQSVTLNGIASGDNVTYSWSPADYLDDPTKLNPVATPPSDITYTLNVISSIGCSNSSDNVFVKVYKKVVVQNTFSPNGDGINDTWNIIAADAYPKNVVSVFNRSGGLVFTSNGYKNEWDGRYKGKVLPVGVYYYTIYLDEVHAPLSGWVTIIK